MSNTRASGKNHATAQARLGYDAAVALREEDVLKRWPFAAEIYQAIVSSPPEWSTRVGIYAPWGVGKTSVLKFVENMAEADDHLVVWFNPWMHSTSNVLWQAFVQAIATKLRKKRGVIAKGAWAQIFKSKGEYAGSALASLLSVSEDPRVAFAGAMIGQGIGSLRHFFTFNEADIKRLRSMLGDKRLIILIDDLDRADPNLVPEILLALKEILDVPSVAFVCAFDPKIVGQAMRGYHDGFDDGLKFLEKIIDYPCWLPEARQEDLERLALRDAERYCQFVPVWAIQRILPFVTSTPRSVRQFVRGLRLLQTSAHRYHEYEINWMISLCSQVLQARVPNAAAEILDDKAFWAHLAEQSFMDNDRENNDKTVADISAKVDRLIGAEKVEKTDAGWLTDLLGVINRELNTEIWTIGARQKLNSLPTVITIKELDNFLERESSATPSASALRAWLAERKRETGSDAYKACLHRLLGIRHRMMLESYETLLSEERDARLQKTNHIDIWLHILVIELGLDESGRHRWAADELKALRDEFAYRSSQRNSPEEIVQRETEVNLLVELVNVWSGDLRIWAEVIGSSVTHGEFDGRGEDWISVWRRLSEIWNTRLSKQLAKEFVERPDLVVTCIRGRSVAGNHIRDLLEDAAKTFWRTQRTELIKELLASTPTEATRRNAFDLLDSILPEGRQLGVTDQRAKALLGDEQIAQALFTAATSRRVVIKGIHYLLRAVRWCERNEIKLIFPKWWVETRQQVEKIEKDKTVDSENSDID